MAVEEVPILIVGLGNPGARYEASRHNAGFLVVDGCISIFDATPQRSQFEAELWRGSGEFSHVWFMKPQTFMNLSGRSVAAWVRFFRADRKKIVVVHDELDLDPGVVRIKVGGGLGGHRGLISMHECLGGSDFSRIRVGIGHPRRRTDFRGPRDPADYVLQRLSGDEWVLLGEGIDAGVQALKMILEEGVRYAMNHVNRGPQ